MRASLAAEAGGLGGSAGRRQSTVVRRRPTTTVHPQQEIDRNLKNPVIIKTELDERTRQIPDGYDCYIICFASVRGIFRFTMRADSKTAENFMFPDRSIAKVVP
jgi:hypothetical protein